MTPVHDSTDLLTQLLAALRRQWRRAAVVGAAVLGLAVAAFLALPREYQSEALLFVKVGASSVTLDPTATTGQTISLYESRETEINSILQILNSREILEQTVEVLGPEVALGEAPVDSAPETVVAETDAFDPLRSERLGERRQEAVRQLAKSIFISAPKRSTVISVHGTANSPELAQEIVATILERFQEEHLRVNATVGSMEFFERQTEDIRRRLYETNDELLARKNEAGVAIADEQRKNVEKRLSDLIDRMRIAESEMAASTAKIAALEDELAFLPEQVETERTTGISNDAYDRMRDRLYELEIRERDLRSRYTDSHPAVLAVLEQVREARSVVAQQAPERTQIREIVPPARVKAEEGLVEERSRKASLAALAEALEVQHGELLDSLRTMNDEEVEIARLEREKSVLEGSYRLAAEKLEQARIQLALSEDRVSNVNVIQPASFDSDPISPKASVILGAGILLAALSFVGAAWAFDRFDDSVRDVAELERRLQIPTLARLPRAAAPDLSLN